MSTGWIDDSFAVLEEGPGATDDHHHHPTPMEFVEYQKWTMLSNWKWPWTPPNQKKKKKIEDYKNKVWNMTSNPPTPSKLIPWLYSMKWNI
jgi:hypothetical protein